MQAATIQESVITTINHSDVALNLPVSLASKFHQIVSTSKQPANSSTKTNKKRLIATLQQIIAEIDQLINQQLDSILQHTRVQELESAWRSLQYLVTGLYR